MNQSMNGITESALDAAFAELPCEIYRQALKDVIRSNCTSELDDCSVKIEAGSSKGDNYIGDVYRVNVEDKKNEKKLSVIIKLPPQNTARREQYYIRPCFLRESEFYDVVYPLYKKFQEEKGIDVAKDGFYEIPTCYKSLTDDAFEGLYLEDLKVSGFEMFDRFKDTTVDHVNRVMEVLGKYHAISFAIKDQKPELIDGYRGMRDIFVQREGAAKETLKVWFDTLKKQVKDSLKESTNKEMKLKIDEVLEMDFFELLMSCVDGALAEPYSILAHGDCWNNNIMFRNENGVPVEVRLLDWQIMRYASPVCDLLYYIFGCTTKPLRDKHYYEFLNVYYSSLASFLRRLGSDPLTVFPRKAFNEHLLRFGKFGLGMAIVVLPIFTSNIEDIPDMDEMVEKFSDVQNTDEDVEEASKFLQFTSPTSISNYNARMLGVCEDMFDLGYI